MSLGDELRSNRLRRLHEKCLDEAAEYPWALHVCSYSDEAYYSWSASPGYFPEDRWREFAEMDLKIRRGQAERVERYVHDIAHVRFWQDAIRESWVNSECIDDDPVPLSEDWVLIDGLNWYGGFFDGGRSPQTEEFQEEQPHATAFNDLLRELAPELFASSDDGIWRACSVSGITPYGIGRLYETLAQSRGFVIRETQIGPFELRWLVPNIFLALARAVEVLAEAPAPTGQQSSGREAISPRLTVPMTPKELVRIFRRSWDTLKPLLENRTIRAKKLSAKSYQIFLDDMPDK